MLRRVLPEPTIEIGPEEAYRDPGRAPVGDRPWVLLNMVASVDGATTLSGVSGGLGGPADHEVFAALRAVADVVLVGASTVRAERYRPPRKAGQRIAVVTRSGDLDWSWELFTSGAGLPVLPIDGPDVPVPALRAGRGDVDLATALRALRAHGAGVVLCEGGPIVNGALLAADLVDELCLTVAPVAAVGTSARIAAGPVLTEAHRFHLAHVLAADDGELLLRYVRAR